MISIDRDRLNDVIEEICEDYCVWPDKTPTQARLNRHCDECPLNNILNEEYWKERERNEREN